jgi:hypothetical protein
MHNITEVPGLQETDLLDELWCVRKHHSLDCMLGNVGSVDAKVGTLLASQPFASTSIPFTKAPPK